ncbi:DnaJ/Hsp40 cysteine-rich domain superfamily protein [Rhynchospora pubera]|uniref:DnaJ/Hsp40 cysteine-rich domain superfamily protein n=1 Tax=Rhynchospora pubera TaxID=906938 RepID=A0AAV8BPL6_9POAL|nr:DnaJ/Hsp40 cysteine-rich domain superfamily protein [Rhynchospora pubera]KAJ4801867.1 DnaJ/Hsp40 cysteine-rich domain superfamily protein [Rhynchospora pubera]
MAISCYSSSKFLLCSPLQRDGNGRTVLCRRFQKVPSFVAMASSVDSSESSSSSFAKRIERAWLISQQPRPIACSSCESKGYKECEWCSGTGFFILGNNMLCEVPSRNTTCVICAGKGNACCADCKGTGFRAKWLEESPH